MRVGFIGVGNIGNPMCANVIKAGHEVVVHDLVEERAANLIELGAEWVDSPAEAAKRSEVVLTSLPGPPEVETVLTGAEGILAGAEAGTVYLDLSTNLPAVAQRLSAAAAEYGVTMLDAPVSGGVVGAENATLAVMVGGDREAFDRYEPLLQAIGENIFHMGEVGSGVLVKLINNMVALTSQQIVHEAVVLAEASGLDPLRAHEVMSVSSAQRYVAGIPRLLERDFDDPPFSLALAAKDVRLALEVAADANVALPVSAAAHENLLRAKARGLGDKGLGATLLVYEEAARITP
jgi:3-hydroxyisobutyrate dehydrogenase-like beta-hydroxyacid dehydrogenase